MAFTLAGWSVSEPINGVKHFSAKLVAVNFNAGITYDNAVTTKASPLLEVLREHGTNLIIRHLSVQYIGAAGGILLQPTFYCSDDVLAFEETHQTAFATDKCAWPGLHIPVRFAETYHYLLRMTVTGYAATDDMTVTVHGEVW